MGQRLRVLILLVVVSGAALLLGSSLTQWLGRSGGPPPPSALPGTQGRVRVEVLNSGGVPGVARTATRVLRDRGFDVVYYGNARTFSEDSSVVVDRVGNLQIARSIAAALGIRNVRSEPDSSLYLEATVRLGPEWAAPGESGEPGGAGDSAGARRVPGGKGSTGSTQPSGR